MRKNFWKVWGLENHQRIAGALSDIQYIGDSRDTLDWSGLVYLWELERVPRFSFWKWPVLSRLYAMDSQPHWKIKPWTWFNLPYKKVSDDSHQEK